MSGKSIPPPPSGGSPSGASTRNLDPMPRRGEVASIGGKRDFRAPSSRRSSPMGGSASRPRARSVGSLPSPTAGTAPMMRQSSSGAASPSRWCAVPRPQCVGKVEIRSCPKILPKGARVTVLRPCLRSSSHCLRVLPKSSKSVSQGFAKELESLSQGFASVVRSRESHFATSFAARHQSQSLSIAASSHPSGTGLNLRFSPSSLSKHSHPLSKPAPTTVRCRPVTVGVTRHTSHFFPSGALKFMYGTRISGFKQKA
jgi:hypothetical protein